MRQALYFVQRQACKLAMMAVCGLAWTSCGDILDNGYGDCEWECRVKFQYDYNMKYADAFAHEVKSVTLYAFDEDGNFLFQNTEQGDMLAEEGYAMTLDEADPDKEYHFVTWAGLEGEESFAVPLLSKGKSTLNDLTCRMNREASLRTEDGMAVVKDSLKPLFHGELASMAFSRAGRERTITIPLKKNTNDIVVMLQQYSEGLDVSQFDFRITDDNGLMAYNNKLLEDETLTYIPWDTITYQTIKADETNRAAINEISTVKAKLTVGRLMAEKHPRLTIINKKNGEKVLSVPLTDCLLLAKQNDRMGDQEYLDRQDVYNMMFFLDDNLKWVNTEININGWVVRYNQIGL